MIFPYRNCKSQVLHPVMDLWIYCIGMLKIITKKLNRQHRFFNHLHNFSTNVRIFHPKELFLALNPH